MPGVSIKTKSNDAPRNRSITPASPSASTRPTSGAWPDRAWDHWVAVACLSDSRMPTESPASWAATASDTHSVDLPEPPFCVTSDMTFIFSDPSLDDRTTARQENDRTTAARPHDRTTGKRQRDSSATARPHDRTTGKRRHDRTTAWPEAVNDSLIAGSVAFSPQSTKTNAQRLALAWKTGRPANVDLRASRDSEWRSQHAKTALRNNFSWIPRAPSVIANDDHNAQ